MVSGSRTSADAVARDREKSRIRAAAKRAANREQYNADMRKYNANNRERVNEARVAWYGAGMEELAERPFIGWDGEGYSIWIGYANAPPERRHFYMLFGCSHDIYDPLLGRDLGTVECLEYMLSIESRYPKSFHVGFAFDYDVNMILKDLEPRHLKHLSEFGMVHWKRYRIAYIKGKKFTVTKGNKARGEKRVSITIYDAFGFFHSKYTTSLIKFGVATEEEIEGLIAGKEERPNFTYNDIDFVLRYWQEEIGYMPLLMDKVREACYDAGLYIRVWHGPGALASYLLRKRGAKEWYSKDVPVEAQIAKQYAMAGGRFQFWRFGLLYGNIYTADINSAYIYACSLLPNLATGRWRRILGCNIDRERLAHFGLYHIRYDAGKSKTHQNHRIGAFEEVHPLFNRDKRGNLFWPPKTDGWYWSPEARTVADSSDADFVEAWVYDDDGSRPFEWVHTEFDKRLQLQHEHNPAEKTFKWALAAMYGAFAQSVGWDKKEHKPPPSHELMFAGFITSWCRAEMYRLAYQVSIRGGLISIDTDGITSTIPFKPEWLDRGIGENLGQWKIEKFTGILYCQSGFYWLRDADGEWTNHAKTRGVKRGSVSFEDGMKAYQGDGIIRQKLTHFTGFKQAMKRRNGMRDQWRTWSTITHRVRFGGNAGIRENPNVTHFHNPLWCKKCRVPDAGILHIANHGMPRAVESEKYKLPWLDDDTEERERDLITRIEDETDNL